MREERAERGGTVADLPSVPVPTSGGAVGPCPACGSERMRAVSDGFSTNFLCESCGVCWFYTMGWLGRVDPITCPGCSQQQRNTCRARALARGENASSNATGDPSSRA
jgi:hypothetical protein